MVSSCVAGQRVDQLEKSMLVERKAGPTDHRVRKNDRMSGSEGFVQDGFTFSQSWLSEAHTKGISDEIAQFTPVLSILKQDYGKSNQPRFEEYGENQMQVAIFGATGSTGIELTKQALEAGHAVTAFVRDPARLTIKDENLTQVTGDVFDAVSVARAIHGQDAVVCALGAGSELKKTTTRTTGTINIIRGMQRSSVKRLVVVSAMGVGESWDTLSLFNKFFFATLLKSARDDHETQEAAVKESGLDWTIIRPSGLTDAPRTGVYNVGENISAITSKVARADVADLIIKELEQNVWIGKAVTITN